VMEIGEECDEEEGKDEKENDGYWSEWVSSVEQNWAEVWRELAIGFYSGDMFLFWIQRVLAIPICRMKLELVATNKVLFFFASPSYF
jgi:hypothetical protein